MRSFGCRSPDLEANEARAPVNSDRCGSRAPFRAPATLLVLDQSPAPRVNLRAPGGTIGWDIENNGVNVRMPVSDHRYPVTKFHHAFAFGCFGILDPD